MKYEISLSKDETYVKIRVAEAITGEVQKKFSERAIKESTKHNIKKFLVDVRGTPNVSSTFEQYFLAHEHMDRLKFDRTSKIAVLIDAGEESHNFIETVFQNAGYRCRLFPDEGSALKWLEE